MTIIRTSGRALWCLLFSVYQVLRHRFGEAAPTLEIIHQAYLRQEPGRRGSFDAHSAANAVEQLTTDMGVPLRLGIWRPSAQGQWAQVVNDQGGDDSEVVWVTATGCGSKITKINQNKIIVAGFSFSISPEILLICRDDCTASSPLVLAPLIAAPLTGSQPRSARTPLRPRLCVLLRPLPSTFPARPRMICITKLLFFFKERSRTEVR